MTFMGHLFNFFLSFHIVSTYCGKCGIGLIFFILTRRKFTKKKLHFENNYTLYVKASGRAMLRRLTENRFEIVLSLFH